MIEEGLRRRGHGSTMNASKKSSPSNKLDDRANAKLVDDLRKRNASLKKANTDLREKLRLAVMENKKAAGKRRVLVPRRNGVSSKTAPAMARDENLQGMLKSFANTSKMLRKTFENFREKFLRRFFGLQASYRAQNLTVKRSRRPGFDF